MGGGGGGQTGGTVVGGPAPWAAMTAGLYQQQAAQQAASAAKEQTTSAINLIREQYNNAFTQLKPYTSEGIKALNELNSYMGLGAYNPGTAPVKPSDFTQQSILSSLTNQQINEYINKNSNLTTFQSQAGPAASWLYSGKGSEDAKMQAKMKALWQKAASVPGHYSGYAGGEGVLGIPTAVSSSGQMAGSAVRDYARAVPGLLDMIKQGAAEDIYNQGKDAYAQQMNTYNQQMDLYNEAQNLAENYQSLTPDQVQEKLMAQPGVGFQYNQGLDAIQRAASAKGMLGSGRLLQSLSDYGQGMASQQYGATLQRLAGIASMGQQSATTGANVAMNLGNTTGQLTANLGDTLANSYLASGNAMSQALLAANQQYKVIGQQDSGGGGLGGIGSILGGIGSIASSGLFSSKALKTKVSTPSTEEILDNVKSLEIDNWKYKGIDGTHIGPYAEDFAEKFNVGDGKTINIIDALGVLFASVKELSIKLDKLQETK